METNMDSGGGPEGAELVKVLDNVVIAYKGDIEVLERAIGMLFVARQFGWKPLLLMNDPRTVRKAEKLLGISFRETYPAVGPYAWKSIAWALLDKARSFWRTLRGDFPYTRTPEVADAECEHSIPESC